MNRAVLPCAALSGENAAVMTGIRREVDAAAILVRPFQDPDPFHELVFANPIVARRAIADEIRVPLATLSDDDRAFIDALLNRPLARPDIIYHSSPESAAVPKWNIVNVHDCVRQGARL